MTVRTAITPEAAQLHAANPAHSAWVTASAGSGKTKVLVDRFVRLLLTGAPPERILCLTFTRAAATEMAMRIADMLGAWAVIDDDALEDALATLFGARQPASARASARRLFARVLDCPGGLRIKTIHAFAQEILHRFPLEAGVSPHYTLIEDEQERLWLQTVRDEVLVLAAREPGTSLGRAVALLAEKYGNQHFDTVLAEIISRRTHFIHLLDMYGGGEALVAAIREKHGFTANQTSESCARATVQNAAFDGAALKRVAALLGGGSDRQKGWGAVIADWLSGDEATRIAQLENYAKVFLTDKSTPRKLLNKGDDQSLVPAAEREAERLSAVREAMKAVEILEATGAVVALAEGLLTHYRRRKELHAVLDYTDLIDKTVALLGRDGAAAWVLFKLDGGIDHLLVDEAQDTGAAQWSIINALTDEFFSGAGARENAARTVFVVGDEKQSIYSFQGADPAMFAAQRVRYVARAAAAEKDFKEVALETSFRSSRPVLHAVDAVFADVETRAGVSQTPVRHVVSARMRGQPGAIEVWPPITAARADIVPWAVAGDGGGHVPPPALLARTIARRIHGWIAGGEMLGARGRAMQAGDIMILVRHRDSLVEHMVRELKALGVPVAGVDRMKLAEQISVLDMLALAQFVLLPEDDLNLACVLRGPLLGLGEETLFALCHDRKGSLWQQMSALAGSDRTVAAARGYLEGWLGRADQTSVYTFFAGILDEPCPADTVSGRRAMVKRLGADALDPLDELLNAAQDFTRRAPGSLQHFVYAVLHAESELKREQDQGQGQVRIMTVHGAKGLQAPIVILPDTMAPPLARQLPRILLDDGGLPCFVPSQKKAHAAALALREAARVQQLEEYRRQLYVALTRAEERLYIYGWHNKQEKEEKQEQDESDDGEAAAAVSWHDLARRALRPLDQEVYASRIKTAEGARPEIAFAEGRAEGIAAPEAKVICKAAAPATILPPWASRAVAAETGGYESIDDGTPRATPLGGKQGADERRFLRGKLVHRLLQILTGPGFPAAQRAERAAQFLAQPAHALTAEERATITHEVMAVLEAPAHAALFGANSRAEVPIAGRSGGRLVNRRIDRLCVQDNEVWIVDYKTDRLPPQSLDRVPEEYREQLADYAALLAQVYPGRAVKTFLLWTYGENGPCLLEVPEKYRKMSAAAA